MNPRVKQVQYRAPYKLLLTFANDERKQFDLLPYLEYPIYSSLKDESYCRKAKVLLGTVAWDEAVDFDPDTLYLESKGIA
jgi:hypothetical protein